MADLPPGGVQGEVTKQRRGFPQREVLCGQASVVGGMGEIPSGDR
jgi:hypothetical protein